MYMYCHFTGFLIGYFIYCLLVAKVIEDVSDEPDLETTIEAVADGDPSLVELNLNNHSKISSEHIERLMEALMGNRVIEKLLLANIKFDDNHSKVI